MFHVKHMDGRFIFSTKFFLLFYLFIIPPPDSLLRFIPSLPIHFFPSLFVSFSFPFLSPFLLSLFPAYPPFPSLPSSPFSLPSPFSFFLLFPASPYSILSVPPFFASLYFSVHTLSFSGFKFLFYHMFHVKHYRSTCQPIPFSNLSFKQSIHF